MSSQDFNVYGGESGSVGDRLSNLIAKTKARQEQELDVEDRIVGAEIEKRQFKEEEGEAGAGIGVGLGMALGGIRSYLKEGKLQDVLSEAKSKLNDYLENRGVSLDNEAVAPELPTELQLDNLRGFTSAVDLANSSGGNELRTIGSTNSNLFYDDTSSVFSGESSLGGQSLREFASMNYNVAEPEIFRPTYTPQQELLMKAQHEESRRLADESSREKGLSRESMEDPLRYKAEPEPVDVSSRVYGGLEEYDPARLRGSSLLRRAGVVEKPAQVELPSIAELEQQQGGQIYKASQYQMRRPQTISRGLEQEQSSQEATTTPADETAIGNQEASSVDRQTTNVIRGDVGREATADVSQLRGEGEQGVTATELEATTEGESSSVWDTIGSVLGKIGEGTASTLDTALAYAGPLGEIAGIGMGVYSIVESMIDGDKAEERKADLQNDLNALKDNVGLSMGSTAMPTLDTTQFRSGGLQNF